ncbi:MAG: DUF1847 domain-containing protein [Syntrophobacteraceae bacterium]|nr:DUF1847 domain-containing protein [Syntrophobacteraceae bacterium]
MNCVKCKVVDKLCRKPDGHGPEFCPTKKKTDIIEESLQEYDKAENREFARLASVQEGQCYANRDSKPYIMEPVKTRIVEVIEFSQKMGYKLLGIAFCGGVTREAGALTEIFEKHGFEVVGVSCKVGGVPKERIGIKEEEKINIGEHEPMCNPIAQAMLLNDAGVDLNIMLCLCVGHDSLFLKYVKGPTTIMAVKDRVTGHNPLAPVYTSDSYYQRLKKLEMGSEEEMTARLTVK